MIPSVSVAPSEEKFVRKPGKRDIALLLLLAWAIPLLIHLLPTNGASGLEVYVLPLFWVTLAAIYLFGTGAGLLVGLSAPLVKYLIIGFPDTRVIADLAVQVVVFVAVTRMLIRRAPGFWWIGPFAYVAGFAATAVIGAVGTGSVSGTNSLPLFFTNLQTALPGLVILGFIHFVLVKIRPQPDDWDAT